MAVVGANGNGLIGAAPGAFEEDMGEWSGSEIVTIADRLRALSENQDRIFRLLEQGQRNFFQMVEKHEKLITGDMGTVGFLTRLDRLEQAQARRDKQVAWVAGPLIAAVIGLALKVFIA